MEQLVRERSDAELLSACARGGPEAEGAFEALVARHGGMVYHTCRRVLGAREAAEDAAQAVFLVLARKARSVRKAPGAFLHGVALRVALRERGRETALRAREKEATEMLAHRDVSGDAPAAPARAELRERLDQAVERLPRAQREAVVLHYLEGRSHRQVAESMGVSEGAVARHVHRGVEKLRARLARTGLGLSSAALAGMLAGQSAEAACPEFLLAASGKLSSALGSAAGVSAAGAGAAAMAKGILKMMFWAKVKVAAVVLGAVVVVGVGVPTAGKLLGAAEPAAEAKAPAAAKLKPEWKGKLLVQATSGGSNPLFSPDGACVAFDLPDGVGILTLADGGRCSAAVPAPPRTPRLKAWRPDGKALLVGAGRKVWTVTPGRGKVEAKTLVEIPGGKPLAGLYPSPGGKYLLCLVSKRMFSERQMPNDYLVLSAGGRRLAAFKGNSPCWSEDGREVLFNRRDEVLSLGLPAGKEKRLFTSKDCFGGALPKTHKKWAWMPGIQGSLGSGRMLLDILHLPTYSLMGSGGFMGPEGVAFVWKRKGGRNTFSRLGPTQHNAMKGYKGFVAVGRKETLLRLETGGFRAKDAETVMRLVSAEGGKLLREMKPPRTLKYKGRGLPVNYHLAAASPEGVTLLFMALASVQGEPPFPRAQTTVSPGLLLCDAASGKFTRVEFPKGFDLLPPRSRGLTLAPSGKMIAAAALFRKWEGRRSRTSHFGVWLLMPGGSGVVKMKEPARKPEKPQTPEVF